MLRYHTSYAEEELLHVIRVNGSTYEEYQIAVEKIQNINYTDANDYSFLHEAICEEKIEIAIDLMHRGIDVDLQTVNGYTAAQLAVSKEKWNLLSELFKFRPNINLKDWQYGNSLLWDVVFYNSEVRNCIAKDLIKMGANPYSQNHNGKSPFDMVILQDNRELIEVFRQISEPQQQEPEKFRVPKKSRGFFAIKFADYQKYIYVENTTLHYLEDKILDYARICGGKKIQYKFEITPINESSWIVIRCPEKMDFYNYHNLMSWIVGMPKDMNSPNKTICVVQHKNDKRLSYYGVMDKQKYDDTRLVGRFQNGESFSIYLPEASKKDGNAQSFGDVLPIKFIDQYLNLCGFNEEWLKILCEMTSKEIVVEMAI